MKMLVTIQETRVINRTYEVDTDSVSIAQQAAIDCYLHKGPSNAYMRREVPYPPTYKIIECEPLLG